MHPFIWFLAGGGCFFVGVGLVVLAAVVSFLRRGMLRNIVIYLVCLAGVLLVFASATPLANWFYIAWGVVSFGFLLFVMIDIRRRFPIGKVLAAATVCLCVGACLAELPFHLMPKVSASGYDTVYVIGDSISAGLGTVEERTWPRILRDEKGMRMIDRSRAGATVSSALRRQIGGLDGENMIVVVEIGGNDLLGITATPCDQFEEDLRAILTAARSPKRIVVMLELPLLPWHRKYGRIQRRLAREFNAVLVPKRVLAPVFAADGATSDGMHLTEKGQELIADKLWAVWGR